jgi:cytochrome c oxidase cbb3-type subunit IV
MTYETMRLFADTWGLLFMFLVFLAVVGWVFRPGTGKKYEKNAQIPLSEDK